MPTVTAEASSPPAPLPLSLPARIAALLAGKAGDATRLVVAGDLGAPVRDALPSGCHVLDDAQAGAVLDAQGATPVPSPVTAVLVLDGARSGDGTAQRLGSACRRFPGRVVVWQRDAVPDASSGAAQGATRGRSASTSASTSPLDATHFFAHGFRRLLAVEHDGVRHAVFEYRLADYKRPPDWLNARFWANPERFGLAD